MPPTFNALGPTKYKLGRTDCHSHYIIAIAEHGLGNCRRFTRPLQLALRICVPLAFFSPSTII